MITVIIEADIQIEERIIDRKGEMNLIENDFGVDEASKILSGVDGTKRLPIPDVDSYPRFLYLFALLYLTRKN
ncbi:hypothetical protein T12_3097 [Trichinella patagoniensis]|uniref:Uncharacterized protein n=1 Tax=Trichinella patagoniensis TaxID=990121 RepID=A0A0V0Z689_9BILA|nr:hypothetical protein T12_3097 [Trichinella patagoniensis]